MDNNRLIKEQQNQEIGELKETLESIKGKLEKMEEETVYKDKKIEMLERKMERWEKKERENNIIIKGIQERRNETEEDRMKDIEHIMNEKLKIRNLEFKECIRLGKYIDEQRPRPILATCKNLMVKEQIMKEKTKLKGTKVFIEKHLTERERKVQLKLLDEMWRRRKLGEKAQVRGLQLLVDKEVFEWKEDEGRIKKKDKIFLGGRKY